MDFGFHAGGGVRGAVRGNPEKTSQGWRFDGRDDCIHLGVSSEFDFRSDITLEVVARVPPTVASGGLYMMVWRGDEKGGHDPYCFSFSKGNLEFRRDFPDTVRVVWPASNLDFTRFHVLTAVHRPREGLMQLWVDGRKVAQTKVRLKMKYDTEKMRTLIGAMDGRSQFFTGTLSRVRIFARALEVEEIERDAECLALR